MVFYERTVHREIRKWAGRKTIIVVTGMRRTGKTSLLRMLFEEAPGKNKAFLDMENPVAQRVFRERTMTTSSPTLKPTGST